MIEALVPQFTISVDGSPISRDAMADVLEVVVENSLNLPDACSLRIHDADFKWLDSTLFEAGKAMKVEAQAGAAQGSSIFEGEIVGVELDLNAFGAPSITVRCMDLSHRLHRGRQSRSFSNVKDSDVVKQIGGEMGFSVDADATSHVYPWIFQNNQSNWEFLQERAAANGFRLAVKKEKTLTFKKVDDSEANSATKIEWGVDLRSFRPRVSASTQMSEVEVRAWDPKEKQPISAKATKPNSVPKVGMKEGGPAAASAFGTAKYVVTDRPVDSIAQASDLARSICDEIGGGYVEAEGLCSGNPALRAGKAVEVTNIGKRFSGKYVLTSTTHTYTPTEGFSTLFTVSGKTSGSLLSLIDRDQVSKRRPMGGSMVIGIVTDNKDPENAGRVKVMYPWLTEGHTSYWARTCSQMAGKGRGFYNLPEIGDEVMVAFEHGEISRPIVMGMLWNGKDGIPDAKSDSNSKPVLGGGSEVNRRSYMTRIGHLLDFDDTDGKGKIMVKSANGHVFNIDDAEEKCDFTTKKGHKLFLDDKNKKCEMMTTNGHQVLMDDSGSKIVIKTKAGHTVTLDQSGGKIKVNNPGGDKIEMEDGGTISIQAIQSLSLKAPNITIAADAMLEMSGATTSLTAKSQNKVEGAQVSVQGSAMVSVQGALVKIN